MKTSLTLLFLTITLAINAQLTQPPFTPATERLAAYEARKALQAQSLVNNVPFKNIGPTVFGGRVVDIAVNPDNPIEFYVAYASGGLWKTENNGTSFEPLFDDQAVMTTGAVAVDWATNTVWLATGEVNSSRSSYAGVGVYKSMDGGKTWAYKGLGESHHIGRIVLHPTDPNTLWVAVLGHLYSPNKERGVYKTVDGGETWQRTLYVNDNAGAIDLVMDPMDVNILYAATWERTRRAWNFEESGAGSGIHRSTDGGMTWTLLNDKNSGFPSGKGVGRIGLAMSNKDGKSIVYAVVDNYFRREKEDEKEDRTVLTKERIRELDVKSFLALADKQLADFLETNGFPEKYTAKSVKEMVKSGKIEPIQLKEYLEDANSLLFDTPVIGAEVYMSESNGEKWTRTHDEPLDNVFYSYGYYFAQIRASFSNPDHLYIMGVPVLRSKDGGKTWASINGANVHVDHHALWTDGNHLILGNDGGINISYDDGDNWIKCNTPAVGQFYYIAVDNAKPYNVYGGLQDNGVWMGSHNYKASNYWHNSGQYPYKSIMGGDGMQIAIDSRDNATVYTGYQFGNYFRLNTKTEAQTYITPKHELGERPLRWNWQAPIHLSKHNEDILYMGSNKVHRSFNQGDDFETISDDLTTGGKKGDVAFSTLTALHESDLKFGLLYAGTDDGLVHVTKDGGNTWTNISVGLPEDMWVTRIQASAHDLATVYVSLNGYRWDNQNDMIYASTNYGQTWKKIGQSLPNEAVNVIKEDPKNANLLYVGTDHGLYISLDKGANFMPMGGGLPAVSVHDVVVHPRENDLLVGTHGRSIYLANIAHVQALTPEILASSLHLFDLDKVRYNSRWGSAWSKWLEPRVPEVAVPVFINKEGKYTLTIRTKSGIVLQQTAHILKKGLNYPTTDLAFNKQKKKSYEKWLNEQKGTDAPTIKLEEAKNGLWYLRPGTYEVVVAFGRAEEVVKELVME